MPKDVMYCHGWERVDRANVGSIWGTEQIPQRVPSNSAVLQFRGGEEPSAGEMVSKEDVTRGEQKTCKMGDARGL